MVMCLIMACALILFNPIMVIIGWENGLVFKVKRNKAIVSMKTIAYESIIFF
ncbi:hypothetical protein BPUM_0366 [Bacillus pumilus SAFR-032]|uniref:Uncharacterized protein n=1 Tax=Bacillus pumilus (strain SAFR-032) TaxID=315750 RepID=A8F9Z4_BACP2|nr:hypothetical protein BPUM_0366 [Bacillus pumilus SAFR-032]